MLPTSDINYFTMLCIINNYKLCFILK